MVNSILLKTTLLESADKIVKVSDDSIKEYVKNIDLVIAMLNESMLEREDIFKLIGGENHIAMMKSNHDKHIRFVAAILQTHDSDALVETLLWVFRIYLSRGFSPKYWEVQISTLMKLLEENISKKAFSEISSIYNWMYSNIYNFTMDANEKLEKTKSIYD